MEWGNAKKFVIILLVLLNLALGVLNFRQRQILQTNALVLSGRKIP